MFLANLLIDFVMIMSIFPAIHSSIILLNSSRFSVCPAYTIISKNTCKCPFIILFNKFSIVLYLHIVAAGLFFAICRNSAICSYLSLGTSSLLPLLPARFIAGIITTFLLGIILNTPRIICLDLLFRV